MYTRKIIGIIAIVLGVLGWFALGQKTSPGTYEYPTYANVIDIVGAIWIILSLGNKIAMIFKKRWWILPFSSCISFTIFFIMTVISIKQIVPYEIPIVYEVLTVLWILGWVSIDAFDAFIFHPS